MEALALLCVTLPLTISLGYVLAGVVFAIPKAFDRFLCYFWPPRFEPLMLDRATWQYWERAYQRRAFVMA